MGFIYMLVAVLNFTAMNVCLKYLKHIPAVELVLFRGLLTLLMSYFFLKVKQVSPWGNNKKLLLLRGFFGTVALVQFFYTLQVMPLGTAATIQQLSPIFTLIIAWVWLKEKPFALQWLFFAMAFVGVVIVRNEAVELNNLKLLIGISSAFFAACAYTTVRRLKTSEESLVIVFYFPLVTVPLLLPVALYFWVTPTGIDWVLILLLGVFTQIAQLFLTKAFQVAEAHQVSAAQYLGVVLSVVVGYYLFDEALSQMTLVGILIIMSSVGANTLFVKRRSTKLAVM